ncbi:MAG: phosphonatase-like hydrolase [Bacteroidetes bacterium]|nr:phosphonatase-like hydrolase [Bacteroidota bacterium]
MPLQLLIFDMAGTTIDEDNIVYKTVHRAIQRAGFYATLETVLLHAAGKEKLQAIRDVLETVTAGKATEADAVAVHRDFTKLLDEAYAQNSAKPMLGAELVFQKLQEKGVKVVLNTGYKRAIAEHLLQQLGWFGHPMIDLVVTADDVMRSRPHPDMIFFAMEKLGVSDASLVGKIGDSVVDIEEGLNAGCGMAAGITTGAQTAEQLQAANPTHVFNSLAELFETAYFAQN